MTEHLPEYCRFFQQVVQKWKNELVLFISSTELPLVIIGFKIRAFEDSYHRVHTIVRREGIPSSITH